MSVTVNLPPAMKSEARGYKMLEGTTPEQMFLDLLKREFERKRAVRNARAANKPAKHRDLTPDPDLYCEIKCDMFADESADWESA